MRVRALKTTGAFRFAERVVRNFFDHGMPTYAAALAYRGLFGLFPFMLLLVVLLGVFGPTDALGRLIDEIKAQSSEQVPQQLEPVVEQGREQVQPLEDLARRAQREADGELILVGVGVALWSISALASTLADAFNTAYGVTETRPWWKVKALSLISGPLVALAVIVAVVLMLTGSRVAAGVAGAFGLRELFVLLWGWLRYPMALVLLWAALTVIFRYSPTVTQTWGSVIWGAALAVAAWAVASVGFSIYLAKFADYGVTYGSIGAAVGLLFYLDLTASIVLAGAEFNAATTIDPQEADQDREIPPTKGRTS